MSDALKHAGYTVSRRWGMTKAVADRTLVNDRCISYALAISLGLGALFDEDAKAERAWMEAEREEFDNNTAMWIIYRDGEEGLRRVLEAVNYERNI